MSLGRSAVLIALIVISTGSCRKRAPAPAPSPDRAAREALAAELVAQGDEQFRGSHLHGWRKAAALYGRAFDLTPSAALGKKLRLTRFLVLTREEDEELPSPDLDAAVARICAEPLDRLDRTLCEVARRYREGFGKEQYKERLDRQDLIDAGAFDLAAPIEAYLYVLSLKAFPSSSNEATQAQVRELSERYKDDATFLYLGFVGATVKRAAELQKVHPEFAELFEFAGEALFRSSGFRQARAYLQRALELVPDYTRALNALGNLAFYALEDYPKALSTFEHALRLDPTNVAALFGRGASLHQLERYGESNETLDRMLGGELSRRGRTSEISVRYFRGEGNYYKAYNHYLVGQPAQARECVDLAKLHTDGSESSSYLSGLLYYDERKHEEARRDFTRAIQRGRSNCNAHYYLGLIAHARKEPGAVDHFLRACSCIDATIGNLERQIRAAPGLDLEPAERDALQAKLVKRLADYRLASAEMVRSMIGRSSSIAGANPAYIRVIEEVLDRLVEAIRKH